VADHPVGHAGRRRRGGRGAAVGVGDDDLHAQAAAAVGARRPGRAGDVREAPGALALPAVGVGDRAVAQLPPSAATSLPRRGMPTTWGCAVATGGSGTSPAIPPPQAGTISTHGARNALRYTFQCVAR
jgi:hypothetical protein